MGVSHTSTPRNSWPIAIKSSSEEWYHIEINRLRGVLFSGRPHITASRFPCFVCLGICFCCVQQRNVLEHLPAQPFSSLWHVGWNYNKETVKNHSKSSSSSCKNGGPPELMVNMHSHGLENLQHQFWGLRLARTCAGYFSSKWLIGLGNRGQVREQAAIGCFPDFFRLTNNNGEVYRRKFRSQTSDNMDRWKSKGGKSQREQEKK